MRKLKALLLSGVLATSVLFSTANPTEASRANEVETISKQYINTPYRWGGTTPAGFDCSGFLTFVYQQVGVQLPRTSAQQFNFGQAISGNLMVGDAVFFTTYASGPSHSGIYLGNNNFIHASSSGVRISSLREAYWSTRYIGARRFLPENSLEHNADQLIRSAENFAGALKWAISFEGSADGRTRPGAIYAQTRNEWLAAKEIIKQLPSNQRNSFEQLLEENVGEYVDRAMRYNDAVTAGNKLDERRIAMEQQKSRNIVDDTTVRVYDELSQEILKQQRMLSLVYGRSTRDQIREMYERTAMAERNLFIYPVSVYREIHRLEAHIANGEKDEAVRRYNNIQSWLPRIDRTDYLQQFEGMLINIETSYQQLLEK